MNYCVATIKPWNIRNFEKHFGGSSQWHLITSPEEYDVIKQLKPRYVFFPHWSWLVPKGIYESVECVGFHEGDLPNERGGSPIQNRIMGGVYHTKITAFRIDGGIDTGGVYLKRDICLSGGGEEIYMRIADAVFGDMIPFIVANNPAPIPQEGTGTIFKRRKPEESEIRIPMSIRQLHDFIRALEMETYPKAFMRYGNLRLEFSRSSLKTDHLLADVRISEDEGNE